MCDSIEKMNSRSDVSDVQSENEAVELHEEKQEGSGNRSEVLCGEVRDQQEAVELCQVESQPEPEVDLTTDISEKKLAKPTNLYQRIIKWGKVVALFLVLIAASVICFVLYANYSAVRAGDGLLYDSIDEVPYRRAALVFGCSEKLGKRDNLYFKNRIAAAAELWKAGKVDCIIVSGDNREKYYNEPVAMRKALVKAGVPFRKIVCDYAGLRTLDSVVRAKKVFGLNKLTLVSQRFQNERAAYIAKANGMDVVGYNARDVPGVWESEMREILARVKMWLDVNITDEQPRHLGKLEILPKEGRDELKKEGKAPPSKE